MSSNSKIKPFTQGDDHTYDEQAHDHDHGHDHDHAGDAGGDEGLCETRPSGTVVVAESESTAAIDRREFVKQALYSSAGLTIASLSLGLLPKLARAAAGPSRRLVYIFLRGGADALTFMVPRESQRYDLDYLSLASKREVLFDASTYTNIDSHFRLNSQLQDLLSQNQGITLFGLGSAHETRSHFNQQDNVEYTYSRKGMLSKFLEITGSNGNPYEAISIGTQPPLSLSSKNIRPFVMRKLEDLTQMAGVSTAGQRFGSDYSPFQRMLDFWPGVLNSTALAGLPLNRALSTTAGYTGDFGAKLKEAHRMMVQNSDNRIIALDMGGWDHHSNLKTRVAGHLATLANSLDAFCTDLKASNLWENTTILVMTEFGRKVNSNSAKGADHGRGGVGLLLGGKVKTDVKVVQNKERTLLSGDSRLFKTTSASDETVAVTLDYRAVMNSIFLHLNGGHALSAHVFDQGAAYGARVEGLFEV